MPNLGGPEELVLILVAYLVPLVLVLPGIYGVVRPAERQQPQRAGVVSDPDRAAGQAASRASSGSAGPA